MSIWAQPAAPVPNAPKVLQPPDNQTVTLVLQGRGKQIYTCQNTGGAYAWKLKGPEAKLLSDGGEVVGKHFAGPTWEANDGSSVTGKLAASVPSPEAGSIPWLLLTAAAHDGNGTMAGVQSIQRLNTAGGVAPATGCGAATKDEQVSVDYTATYYFYSAASIAQPRDK